MARIRWTGVTLLVALLYFACARLGLMFAFADTQATPLWPPSGIALALTLLLGVRVLPGVFLGAFAANIYQSLWVGTANVSWALPSSLGIALGNTLEILLANVLIQQFAARQLFSSVRGVLVFVAAVVAGSLLAALIGTLTLVSGASDSRFVMQFALTWWLGDAAAMLLLTPFIMAWSRRSHDTGGLLRLAHLLAFSTVFVLAMNLWYAPIRQDALSLSYAFVMLPLFVWGALAFGVREITLMLFAFSSFLLFRTVSGESPATPDSLNAVLLQLQWILCVIAASVLVMHAGFAEGRRWRVRMKAAEERQTSQAVQELERLRYDNRGLQQQVQQYARNERRLQESEDRLALITQATTDGIWEWEPARRLLRYSTRFRALLGYTQFDQLPQSLRFWLRRVDRDDRHRFLAVCRAHLTDRAPLDCNFRMRNKTGQLRWYRIQGHAIWDARNRPVLLAGSISDVHGEKLAHDILVTEKRLLERMTSGAPLQEVLQWVVELLGARYVESGLTLALVDAAGVNLELMAQRKLAEDLRQFLQGIKVGPQAISLGAAIYFNTPIIVDNIDANSDWRPFMPLMRARGIKACWAIPIRNRHGSVLGALAVNFAATQAPDAEDSEFLDRVARLAGIAVEQNQIRSTLQRSEQRFRELYHHNPAMFFSLTGEGRVVSVNQFGAEHLGYSPAELVDRDYTALIEPQFHDDFRDALAQTLALPGRVQVFEARKRCADGRLLWVRDSLRAWGGDGERMEILVVAEDITDIRELSDRLAYHASHDPLTGLINRRKFEAELVNAIYEANTLQCSHALCYLDLDLFKVINDACGHAAGDELLRQLGQLLRDSVGERGVIARLGGDEFGLLILNTDAGKVQQLAGEIRDRIVDYQFVWERRPYHVGVSIGVAMITRDTANLTSLMVAADSACYAAKEAGRNRIQCYHEDDALLRQRRGEMQWVTLIPRGIRENRFALALQDIVPMSPRMAERHVELLLRYRSPDGQWISPQVFLPAAERYSLATLLDRWVFVQLAHLLETQSRLRDEGIVFNVNLSGQSVTNEEFRQFLIYQITSRQLPAANICFEITETSAITNLPRAKEFIEALKALGCRFALDDFGSGLSTFGYLKGLPVDYIKIDGQFVRDIVQDEMDFAIVKSINEVGHVLGKQTIAEGVENADIARRLQMIGVDWAQGFHLSQPQLLAEWLQRFDIAYEPVVMVE